MERTVIKELRLEKTAKSNARRGQNPAVFTCKNEAFAAAETTEKAESKARILPFFIPMEGCPNKCIFCEQKQISSHSESPSTEQIKQTISQLTSPHELAFYGGSFTMLPFEKQQQYLEAAAEGLEAGIITSIRISTRPDSIDEEGLEFLWRSGVRTIELGIQSLDEEVLHTAGRYYNIDTVFAAAEIIKKKGFNLGLQLMPGLPKASHEKDLATAKLCLQMQPDFIRIYPTLVLQNTSLAEMYKNGDYAPLSLEEAVGRCRDMAALFLANDIPIIRMGLHNTQSLQEGLIAGPFDEAFGALVYSSLAQKHMQMLVEQTACQSITAHKSYLPLLFGHKGCNRTWLAAKLPEGLHGSTELPPKCLEANGCRLSEKEFLMQYIDKISSK